MEAREYFEKEYGHKHIETVVEMQDWVSLYGLMDEFAEWKVKNCSIPNVSGMLPLTENAKQKLEYINGSCIARDFPKEQPTKQWAGAVLDLLEELGLGN